MKIGVSRGQRVVIKKTVDNEDPGDYTTHNKWPQKATDQCPMKADLERLEDVMT